MLYMVSIKKWWLRLKAESGFASFTVLIKMNNKWCPMCCACIKSCEPSMELGSSLMQIVQKIPQDMWHWHNHMKKEWVVDSHAWWPTTTSIFLLLAHTNTTISIYHYFMFILIIKFFYEINVTKRNVCCYYSCFTTCVDCLPRQH